MRQLNDVTYNSNIYTDENLLYRNGLIDTVRLDRNLTYLFGMDNDMFPLLFFAEAQGGVKKVKRLNDSQYVWDVMGRMKHTSRVVSLSNTNNTKPGLGYTTFGVVFEDNWLIGQYSIITPDKSHVLRIQGEPKQLGPKKYEYQFQLFSGDTTEYVSLDNFVEGLSWVMSTPHVAASKSDGNRSNNMTPGRWTNQYGWTRFSKQIAGNVGNKVTPFEFKTKGGGTTTKWMPEEMKQFEIDRRLMLEDDLWNSVYNRDEYGQVHTKDPETGEPIPTGAGVKEILKSVGQHDTYSSLTLSKFDSIVNTIFSNRVDKTPMELVMYTGNGGFEMFNNAIKSAANSNSYYEKLGQEEIMSGKDGYLSYGRYFSQYKTVNGHIITIKKAGIFDNGVLAEMDKANGNLLNSHPAESYNFMLLDHSRTEDGTRNLEFVAEEGRETITGVYKGMSPLPGSWGALERTGNLLSTRKDVAAYEVMASGGITLRNPYTSYYLEFVA